MNAKTINGKIFIIPNTAVKESDFFEKERYDKFLDAQNQVLSQFEDLRAEQPMIQVWAFNKACDNFSCHHGTFAEMLGSEEDEYRFPTYLPFSVLKDLKEGETITLKMKNGVEFRLVASQTTTRYRDFGTFEEVLTRLCPYEMIEA